jgi:hypothetical protein
MGLRRAVGGVETFFVEAGEGRPDPRLGLFLL